METNKSTGSKYHTYLRPRGAARTREERVKAERAAVNIFDREIDTNLWQKFILQLEESMVYQVPYNIRYKVMYITKLIHVQNGIKYYKITFAVGKRFGFESLKKYSKLQ